MYIGTRAGGGGVNVKPHSATARNTFIDVKDTGSEASRDWASHAKTEPPGAGLNAKP